MVEKFKNDIPAPKQADFGSLTLEDTPEDHTTNDIPPVTPTVSLQAELSGGQSCKLSFTYPDFVFSSSRGEYFFSKNTVTQIENLNNCHSFLYHVTEYDDVPGIGVLELQCNIKYAHVLARKRLEERGELTPQYQLVIYAKTKGAAGEIRLLYQIVPKGTHANMLRNCANYGPGMVYLDTLSLLRGVIMAKKSSVPLALALRSENSILLLVGRGNNAYLARRYALMGEKQTSLQNAIYAMRQDIALLQHRMPGHVESICWIDPLSTDQECNAATRFEPSHEEGAEAAIPVTLWPPCEMTFAENNAWSTLPELLKLFPQRAALGPKEETWIRPLERTEQFIWAALAMGIILFVSGFIYFNALARTANHACAALEQQITQTQATIPELMELEEHSLAPIIDMSELLSRATTSKPLVMVWNSISQCKPREITMNKLAIKYGSASIDVEMKGDIRQGMVDSQATLLKYTTCLKQAGFSLTQRALTLTGNKENSFTLHVQTPRTKG